MNTDNILEIKDLHTSFENYGEVTNVLNGISFEVQRGKILGIVGESGSGKSVTAFSILKLLGRQARYSGQILLDGENILDYDEKKMTTIRGGKISMIYQDPMTSLNPVYTVGNQIMEVLKLHRKDLKTRQELKNRAIELMDQVGISDATRRLKQYPHELSGGMRQRVVIAMALASDPEILIADEPTTALDVTVQAQILELIKDLTKKNNMTTILITHDLGVVINTCDQVLVMYAGRICEKADVREVFTNPKHEYTKGLLDAVPDGSASKKLIPIEGTPVNLKAMPKGCAFCARCNNAMKICAMKLPEEKSFGNGHVASCFMNDAKEMEVQKDAD